MADNPIKYSDFISPDNSISDLIKQLDELSDAYTNALKNIKGEAIQLAHILKNVSSTTEAGRTATRNAAAQTDKLVRARRDLAFAESENAKVLAKLKAAQREATAINKLLIKRGEEEITMNNLKYKSYDQLSAQYSLNKMVLNTMGAAERQATKDGQAFEAETKAIYEQMKLLQEATGKHTLNVGNYTDATKNLLPIIRQNTYALAEMRMAGKENTAEYKNLQQETAKLKGALANTNAEIKALSSNTSALSSVMSGISVATGAFTALTGSLAAFGEENENVLEVQKKVQGAMALTMGLTTVQANLHKQSAVMLGINTVQTYALAKAEAYRRLIQIQGTKATIGATVAQKAFNLVAAANPYVLLAMALITVVGAIAMFAKGSKEAEKEQAKLNRQIENTNDLIENTAKSAGSQIVTLRKLQKAWNALGNDIKAKNKFIASSKDEFDKLGVKVTDVKDAENLLITNSEAFVKSILLKSRALAGQNLAIKEYERALEDQMKAEQKQTELSNKQKEKPKVGFQDRVVSAFSGGNSQMGGTTDFISPQDLAASRLQGEIKDLKTEMDDFSASSKEAFASGDKYIISSADDAKAAAELLKEANLEISDKGGSGKGNEDKSLKKRQAEISNANKELREEQIKAIKDDTDRQVAEINFQTEQRVKAINDRVARFEDLTQEEKDTIKLIEQNAADQIVQINDDAAEKIRKINIDKEIDLLESQRSALDLKLEATEEGSQAEYDLMVDLLEKERELELAHNAKLSADLRQSESDINNKYNAYKLKQEQEFNQRRTMQMFDMEQMLHQSEFDLLKTTEEEKTRYKLKAEIERWKKILEINKSAAKKMSNTEVQIIENTIARLDKEIAESSKDEKGKDIYSAVGLKLDENEKAAITDSTQFALDQLNSFMEAKVRAADIAVDAAGKEVDSAQARVDQEIEARNNGYANNVALAQKELDMAKKNQDKALKDQAKAQKQQAAIQTIQQVGNLVSASALIWSQLGFPFAIPALGVMWGSFAAAKVKAAQMSKPQTSESYGSGTVELLDGGSHQSGNDVDLGTKKDGTKRRAEGGEFFAVINKRNSRKYRSIIPQVINSLNQGEFESKILGAYDTGGLTINTKNSNPDLKTLISDVKEIRAQKDNEKKIIHLSDGSTMITYKNLSRIIKNQN